MTNEHQQDYGGTCDTCANGVAKMGSRQCRACLERDAEADAHIDEEAQQAAAVAEQQLAELHDYYAQRIAAAKAIVDDATLRWGTVRFLDHAGIDLEYRGVFATGTGGPR